MENTGTPDEVVENARLKEAAKIRARRIVEEARVAINAAPTDKNVEIVLRYLMRVSGFLLKPVVVGVDGDVKVNATLFNSGREALYHDIRGLMSPETKNIIERSEVND